ACFIAPGRVLALTTADKDDDNYHILQNNLDILRNSRDAAGHRFEIIKVPQPKAEWLEGGRLGKSYINFYIANNGVIMPGYGDPKTDLAAYQTVQSCFPNRHVIQIDCRDIVIGGGNIHCITQQEPA
ncbi:MAG: agmatine deiminase family protein, partial [Pseudomonadota bacterium]